MKYACSIMLISAALAIPAQADPPTQEDALKILRQEEERIRNYERSRAEIVSMVPSMERAELNWLARLGDVGYFDAETTAQLDKTGPYFIVAQLYHIQTAALLPAVYGPEGDKTKADELERILLLAKGNFTSARKAVAELKRQIKLSPRWEEWLQKSGLNIPPDDPELNRYITMGRIPRELNVMAVTLDAGLVAPADFPQLDGFGPLLLRGIYVDIQTEEGRKLVAEIQSQVQALYDTWLGLLNGLPQSDRWVAWVDDLTVKEVWRNTEQEQNVLSRLIVEERAARAEKAKKSEQK
jgi:hypothetical protein